MATVRKLRNSEIRKSNKIISRTRSLIETAFYSNNVIKVNDVKTAYDLASKSSGVIKTDMPIYKAEKLGLPTDSNVLVFNNDHIVGRTAKARVIESSNGVDKEKYSNIINDAVFHANRKKMYYVSTYLGLHTDFMAKAHFLVPEGYEHIAYSWLLNFCPQISEFKEMYDNSKLIEGEGDIFVFADPDWHSDEYPNGLAYFDPEHNCACILGLKYFGEYKKGTLTLYWSIATRNGYVACHGGQKRYNLENGENYTLSVFGLSGSGKSTLTHSTHDGKFDITVLHDDAFIINKEEGSSIAIEKSYFDKVQDYQTDSEDNKYLISVQNCGVTMNDKDEVVLLTEDVRNGNGRAVKSEFWAKNVAPKFDESVNAIVWLMKDETLPPVLKITNSSLASLMGATLATKRSTAENLVGKQSMDTLVIEPYANPFRTYPLMDDYENFKSLFENKNVDCYILNTGSFLDKKVTPKVTLDIIEKIVTRKENFKGWHNFKSIEIMEVEGFVPDMTNDLYLEKLKNSFKRRIEFIEKENAKDDKLNKLPYETIAQLLEVQNCI